MPSTAHSIGLLRRFVTPILILNVSGCGDTETKSVPANASPSSSAEVVALPEPEITDAKLSDDLVKVTTGSASVRCEALKRLAEYWSIKRVQPRGFSDLPVDVKQPDTNHIPDGEVEAIATALKSALIHADDRVRKEAAICLCNAPRQSPAVDTAVAVALNSKDTSVLWYLMQLRIEKYQWPDPEPFVPNLIEHLKFKDPYAAANLIERFGERFTPHSKAVVEKLPDIPQENKWLVFLTLARVGLSMDAADILMTRAEDESPETNAAAFVALLKFPSKATRFLLEHHGMGKEIEELDGSVCTVLNSTSPELNELREALIATPDIGPVILALIGSNRSLPELARQLEAADEHRKTLIRACIRACGGELGEVVQLSKDKPTDFMPKSAWPGHDSRRMSNELGHGDGFTKILITGELKSTNGTQPAEVRFFRTNDGMLLGEGRRDALPLKYDPTTGRFVLLTTVFAAYASGKSPEPGPYQTGSAQIQIEATGCSPLKIQFFDEMPHTEIVLPD